MAKCLSSLKSFLKSIRIIYLGRFVVLILLLVQASFFSSYPIWYKDNLRWIAVLISYFPALFYWCHSLYTDAGLVRMFHTWGLYVVLALVPNIAITFAVCGDELDKNSFLGPNTLKVIVCFTPVLFLVLLNTAKDLGEYENYRQLATQLSLRICIDLFDGVAMMNVVLDEKQYPHGMTKELGIVIIAVACLSFVLSMLQMVENKIEHGVCQIRKKLVIIRSGIQMVFVNAIFLIIRVIIFMKYGKDDSIFMAKNGIAIFLSISEIYHTLNRKI